MNVRLWDFDSTIPNLALMKISAYHKSLGDNVGFEIKNPDKIYISCIFKNSYPRLKNIIDHGFLDCEVEIGGSGIDINKKLPDEIEYIMPDYSIYPHNSTSIGYSSRGCIRDCYFCIVRKKEGKLYHNEMMHPKKWVNKYFNSVKLLDNNWFADKEYFMEISNWFIKECLYVDVTQGYDIRLIDNEIAKQIKRIPSYTPIHFAFDNSNIKDQIENGIKILKEEKIPLRTNVIFYCYCNDISQFEDTLERINFLKSQNIGAFCMFNKENPRNQNIKDLQRWSNRPQLFWSCSFKEYQTQLKHN